MGYLCYGLVVSYVCNAALVHVSPASKVDVICLDACIYHVHIHPLASDYTDK